MINWIRKCRLLVGNEKGKDPAIDFSNLRIRFFTRQMMTNTPGSAEIYIYNPAKETVAQLVGEGQEVLLQAGYEDYCDTIFQGQVRQIIYPARESPTDTYVCILAQNADVAHNYAVTNQTLAAGYSPKDERDAYMKSYQKYGTVPGQQDDPADIKYPRGRAIFCMSRDGIQNYAKSNGMQWGYDNNRLVCTKQDAAANERVAFEVNVNTGLIGMPQMTINGVMVTTLLNPRFKHGTTQIKLNNADIQMPTYDVSYGALNDWKSKDMISADGYYNAVSVEHQGDTRGDSWQTMITGVGVNAKLQPVSGAAITGVTPDGY